MPDNNYYIVKRHISDRKLILAVCDPSILGKKFEDKHRQLDLASNFYKGDKNPEETLSDIKRKAYIINIVGVKSVNFFIQKGMIKEESIIKISNMPYAQIFVGQGV